MFCMEFVLHEILRNLQDPGGPGEDLWGVANFQDPAGMAYVLTVISKTK